MAAGRASGGGVVDDIRFDLRRMHETWMELFFPRQRNASSSVLGKWEPKTAREKVTYNTWYYLGIPIIGLLYPLVLLGVVLRFQSRRLDSAALRLGTVGVVFLFILLWGALTAASYVRFDGLTEGFFAVAAASTVAVVAAALAVGFRVIGGRVTTVLFAWPFAMTAIFLPPVVAALYSPTVAEVVLPRSESLAIWLLENPLDFADVNTYLKTRYDLEGLAFAGMWFGLSVPVGWVLGILVTLADLVRPKADGGDGGSDD
ncbi:hypothetical protein BV210_03400 [Halorientalis sp. IM1011]|uniref:hypothetical protein n=1 Tax=Halorientalis sp. IM1011 TaxID=1932360 RepID=UPI00097CD4A8|nr:hypothetical protein [Halorientalis sp. IM1011]AQL41818.1 hypothetical protein BV210_03400 [Halorientalis sp. IM1011]